MKAGDLFMAEPGRTRGLVQSELIIDGDGGARGVAELPVFDNLS
jgi:hypothetical protein